MTGRERTLRALSFEPVHRTPIAGGLLQAPEYLAHRAGVADFWDHPERTAFEAFRNMGCDAVLGPVMPKRPESTTTDASGQATRRPCSADDKIRTAMANIGGEKLVGAVCRLDGESISVLATCRARATR